jgi:hypothetical protein
VWVRASGHVSASVRAVGRSHCWDSDIKDFTLFLGLCFVMCQVNVSPSSSRIAVPEIKFL